MEGSNLDGVSETLNWEKNVSAVIDRGEGVVAMNEEDESLADLMVCDPGARMVASGFNRSDCAREECLIFVNLGGEEGFSEPDASLKIVADVHHEGGEAFRTEENRAEAGDCPSIYQSAPLGNCCYRFNNLPPGHYLVDLQEEKALSELNIFAVVGSNMLNY